MLEIRMRNKGKTFTNTAWQATLHMYNGHTLLDSHLVPVAAHRFPEWESRSLRIAVYFCS